MEQSRSLHHRALPSGLCFSVRNRLAIAPMTSLIYRWIFTRGVFSAAKARSMYYETLPGVPDWQREFAIQQWKTKVTIGRK
jgi:hypothetical protein